MNIVDSILKLATGGNTVDSMSSALGLSRDQTHNAVKAGVPTMLAGLTQLSSTSQGAQQLTDVVSNQDPGILDTLGTALTGRGAQVIDQGSGVANSLLGGGLMSKLSGVLANFTGIGQGSAGKMFGLLTPLILGFLGKQQRTMGLDSGGLATLLSGQKDNIRSAMPAGLGSMLSSVLPGANFLTSGGRTTTTPPVAETHERAEYRSEPIYESRSRPGGARWAIPALLALAVLAGILMWSNRNRGRTARPEMGRPGTQERATVGTSTRLVSDASSLVSQARTTLAGIQDSASADAAVPKLKELNQSFSNLRSSYGTLPESTRQSLKQTIAPLGGQIDQGTTRLLSIPGLSENARTQIQQLQSNVSALSQ